MKFKYLLLTLSFCGLTLHADIYKEGRGMMYGKTYVYSLKAPSGWVLDNKSGASEKIRSVFYKQGESWKGGDVTAYTKATVLNDSVKSVEDVVKLYIQRAQEEGVADYKAQKAYDIQTSLGETGEVYYFASKTAGTIKAVCFFPESKTVNAVIMKAKGKDALLKNDAAFKALSKSYYFVKDEGSREVVQAAFQEMKEKEQEIAQKIADAQTAQLKAEFEEKERMQEEKTQKIINSFFGAGN